jgi:hypothetical protein
MRGTTATFRELLKRAIPPVMIGWIEYALYPDRAVARPFNGQRFRQLLFWALIEKLEPAAIVETGTFRGTTTDLMSQTKLPVFSVELNPQSYGFAQARLWRRRNVTLMCADSRAALLALFDGPLRSLAGRTLFFYLDAHWNHDLPLDAELDITFTRCDRAVVMIDDFQVPFDDGYRFDDYGSDKVLNASYIERVIVSHKLAAFYPTTASVTESGARRGCVVLAKNTVHGQVLRSFSLLSAFDRA